MIDLIRVAAIAEAAVVFGVTLRVFVLYTRANNLATIRGETARALLPRHVTFIAAAFLFYVFAGTLRIIEQVGKPFIWDATPTSVIANTLGLYALILVMRFEQRRVDVEHGYITDLRGAPTTSERRH